MKPPSLLKDHNCVKGGSCEPTTCEVCKRDVNTCLHYTEEVGMCVHCALSLEDFDHEKVEYRETSFIIVKREMFRHILDLADERLEQHMRSGHQYCQHGCSFQEVVSEGKELLKR